MINSPSLSILRRLAVLSVLILTLGVMLFEKSSPVKAVSCSDANLDFSSCYYYCAVQNDYCHSQHTGNPHICDPAMDECLRGCSGYFASYGLSCELAHYSSPVDPNAACEANAARLATNCIAGDVVFAFRDSYYACMVELNGETSYVSYCCGVAEENYLYIGCY